MTPKYFFAEGPGGWNRIRSRWQPQQKLVLFLDYDGTLVPLRPQPSLAVLSPPMKRLLRNLSRHPRIIVGLITGRALGDIKKMTGLKRLGYAANHGFQIWFNQTKWVHPRAKALRPRLARIGSLLEDKLAAIPGALVENKSLTLSVHYRKVREDLVPRVKRTVAATLQCYHPQFKITRGKKVVEIRPNIPWDKGRAVLELLKLLAFPRKPLIFYIGDDRTDEDAFRRLRRRAVTIRVGPSRSSRAKYFVKDSSEVQKLLELIKAMNP